MRASLSLARLWPSADAECLTAAPSAGPEALRGTVQPWPVAYGARIGRGVPVRYLEKVEGDACGVAFRCEKR